jgi:hypothetical protein
MLNCLPNHCFVVRDVLSDLSGEKRDVLSATTSLYLLVFMVVVRLQMFAICA